MKNIPEAKDFMEFTFPLVRKPYPKLEASTPEESEKNIRDLFGGIAKHLSEVMEELKDCKCPKCVPDKENNMDT